MLYNPVKPTEVSVSNRIDLSVVPLEALTPRTRDLVAELLNLKRIFTSEDGYFRDWRGLFDVIGIPKSLFPLVSTNQNPTGRLLDLWQHESQQCRRKANLAELQFVFGCIDRWDVLDDTSKMFDQDAEQFFRKERNRLTKTHETEQHEQLGSADDNIITKDDTHEHKQQYDAFILYADADVEFASKMVERLEQRGMQLCLKDRDILGGSNFEHEVMSRLISERCRRLVVIISKAFLESSLNDFTVTYAQALQIEKKERKVIPCLYDRCELPPHLRFTFVLDYQRSQNFYNFWDKLADSIRNNPRKVATQVESTVKVLAEPRIQHRTAPIGIAAATPKIVLDEPTLIVDLPPTMEMESRTSSLKKSHSFWDMFSSFSLKKDRLNGSTSQLNIGEVVPSTSPKKAASSPLGLIRREKKLLFTSASSVPSECPLDKEEKPAKAKKKWYKPTGRKVATVV